MNYILARLSCINTAVALCVLNCGWCATTIVHLKDHKELYVQIGTPRYDKTQIKPTLV